MMNCLSKIKSLLIALFLLGSMAASAQQAERFKYQSQLPAVDSAGFYEIMLLPNVTAKCKADFSDLRLFGPTNKFEPYIFGSQLPVKHQEKFIAFPQIPVNNNTDSTVAFVAENKEKFTINQLYVQLRNTDVQRTINIAGSDDLAKWYAITENMQLQPGAGDKGIYQQLLSLPASTYRYLRVQINSKNKAPVAILKVGIYQQSQSYHQLYVALPNSGFIQKDSCSLSRITIKLNDNYPVNRIKLDIAGARYYKRDVHIYQINGSQTKLIADTVIKSNTSPYLYFSARGARFRVDIENGDNPPLIIKAVEAYQLHQSLIAYLQKGGAYRLLFGDKSAAVPNYDLKFFADSIDRDLKTIINDAVTQSVLYKASVKSIAAPNFNWLIWGAMLIVAVVLIILTLKMTREINQRKGN